MMRVRTVINGFPAGPALNTFYFDGTEDVAGATACVERVRVFWLAATTFMPNVANAVPDTLVDVVNPVNGQVTDTIATTATATPINGAGGGNFAPPSCQILLKLKTGTFLAGRRLQGRSFIGPVNLANIEGDGTPTAAAVSAVNDAATVMITGDGGTHHLVVWRRPKQSSPKTKPATFIRDGSSGAVTNVSVPNKFATLRSRRD
jgi:hypothetical protein